MNCASVVIKVYVVSLWEWNFNGIPHTKGGEILKSSNFYDNGCTIITQCKHFGNFRYVTNKEKEINQCFSHTAYF